MKAKAQKAQMIRNSLGPSVKAKAQKDISLEIDWASYCKSREAKAEKRQIIRNSFGASVKAKTQKAQTTTNSLGLAVANQSLDIGGGPLLQINESQSSKT